MLLIENFDRLSRAIPIDALALFTEIINAGLTIVTLHDEQQYSRQALERNPYLLFGVFMEQVRANSESAAKSKRIKEVWGEKKRAAKASGKVMTRKTPYWIKANADRTGFELVHARAETILWLVEQAERGVGNNTLIKQLHERGIAAWSKSGGWQPSYMQKVLRSPALFGAIQLNGETIKGYYPALIAEDRFYRLQVLRTDRRTTQATSGRGDALSNLFARKLKCGYCGFAMNISGYKERKSASRSGYERKYVGCHGAKIKDPKGCARARIWFMDELEPKLLLWLTTLNPTQLVGDDASKVDQAKLALASLVGREADVRKRLVNLRAVLEDSGSKSLVARYDELEAELQSLGTQASDQRAIVTALEAQRGSGQQRLTTMIKLFGMMKSAVTAGELKGIRQQLADTISKIVQRVDLHPAGPTAKGAKEDRYLVVTLGNGESYDIDDSDDGDEAYRVDPEVLQEAIAA